MNCNSKIHFIALNLCSKALGAISLSKTLNREIARSAHQRTTRIWRLLRRIVIFRKISLQPAAGFTRVPGMLTGKKMFQTLNAGTSSEKPQTQSYQDLV